MIFIAVHEFVYPSGCIDKLNLSGIKWMGSIGNFQFHQRVLNSVDLHRFLCLNRRPGNKGMTVRHIPESDQSVTIRMYSFFHVSFILSSYFCSDKSLYSASQHLLPTVSGKTGAGYPGNGDLLLNKLISLYLQNQPLFQTGGKYRDTLPISNELP